MNMMVIGVTGGIGAGKSSVSAILKELGAVILDADELSHQVAEAEMPAYGQIVKEFGSGILNSDRTLNRKMLAQIVFKQEALRRKLEAIIHVEVIKSMLERIEDLKDQKYGGLVVLDVPIPVEHGFLDIADRIWVVTADENTRIKRIMKRSGLTFEEAVQRIQSQMSQEEYKRLADEIIENNDGFEELRKRVVSLVQSLSG